MRTRAPPLLVSLLVLTSPRDASSLRPAAAGTHTGPENAGTSRRHWEDRALRRRYDDAGGFAYRQSCLSPAEFRSVRDELDRLDLALEPETGDSFATKRLGCAIPKGGTIHDVMGGGSVRRLVNRLEGGGEGGGDEWTLSSDVPIELRVYEAGGSGMEWHVDDVLFDRPQVEVVFTVDNTSDCDTMWRLPVGEEGRDGRGGVEVRSVQTTPNSALVIRAGGVEHKVSPLGSGRRRILKMAFVRRGCELREDMARHASHHGGGKNKRKKMGNKGKKKR